jgi:hypothetical protein
MTRHDDMVRLRHMLDHAREAVSLIQRKNRCDPFFTSRLLSDLLVELKNGSANKHRS